MIWQYEIHSWFLALNLLRKTSTKCKCCLLHHTGESWNRERTDQRCKRVNEGHACALTLQLQWFLNMQHVTVRSARIPLNPQFLMWAPSTELNFNTDKPNIAAISTLFHFRKGRVKAQAFPLKTHLTVWFESTKYCFHAKNIHTLVLCFCKLAITFDILISKWYFTKCWLCDGYSN